jgi:hypothetical protein
MAPKARLTTSRDFRTLAKRVDSDIGLPEIFVHVRYYLASNKVAEKIHGE